MYMNTVGTVCLGLDACALYSSEVRWLHVCDVLSYITLSVCSTSWQLEMLMMMMMMMTMTMVAMILMVLIILAILMILIILMILMVMPADNNGFRQVESTNIHQLIVVSGP